MRVRFEVGILSSEVKRDALLTGRQAVPTCSGAPAAEEVRGDALLTCAEGPRGLPALYGRHQGNGLSRFDHVVSFDPLGSRGD
jgi:hypothetical protein